MEKSAQVIDFAYLEGFLAGDAAVIREVLALFTAQADVWRAGLNAGLEGWRDVAHTVKGAARGIGAPILAEACERAEFGDEAALPDAQAALSEVVAAIEARLAS
jgi:hypothetical protein